MKNKFTRLTLLTVAVLFLMQNISLGQATAPPLGATAGFAVYTAVGAVNNDGASIITGDVGAFTGPLTGFPIPGTIIGTTHVADPKATLAFADIATAYAFLFAETADVIGIELGGQTLLPGAHSTGGAATLTGTLTLDGNNDPSSIFVIKIDGAFATAANAKVVLINSANVCNVYWQINGVVNLETYTAFQGTVIAAGPFNLFAYATVSGRILATAGAINLHNTAVTLPPCACTVTAPTVDAIPQPNCDGSVVLGGLPAVGSWTINPGGITGTGTTKTISGLAPGTYNFTVTDAIGCISAPSAPVVINALPVAYPAPTIGTITQPACLLPTGSVVLNGLPSSGTWIIHEDGFPFVVLATGTGSTTTLYNVPVGTHKYNVTTADVCYYYSVPSGPVVITAIVPTPTVTITQPANCTSHTGTITVTGLLPGDCYKFSIDGSTYTNTNGIFTDVPSGTYTVTAMNSDSCISSGVNVTIPSLPSFPAPIVGTITQPDCLGALGSVVLSGLPAGTWFINPGAISGTGSSTTLTGLTPGTHNYTVTTAGVCYNYSAQSANIVINAATVAAPTVTVTQPTTYTTPTGTITITAPTGTGMTYSIDGVTYSTNMVYTALPPATYPVTAKNADGCLSSITSVTINPAPSTVASATAQPTCLVATGTITVTEPAPGGGMTYSINGVDYINTTGIFTGLFPGTYTVTSKNSGGYISFGTNVTINAQPGPMAAPTVTLTQPTICVSPTGTITVTAPTGTGMTYSTNGEDYYTNGIFTGLGPGTYPVTAKSADGCVTSVTSVTILAMPLTVATATAQPTLTLATGTITVTSPAPGGGRTYSTDGVNYTNTTGIFTGLVPGTYTVTSKLDNCISSVTSVTINPQPAIPETPVVTLIQPTVTVPTGTITVTPISGYCITYSIDGVDYTNTTGIFTGLIPGTYTVTARGWGGVISLPTSVTISGVTAIKEIGVSQKFEIYPVPNNGHFTVVMNTLSEKRFDILITNALGSKIYQEKNVLVKGKLEHNINMGQVPVGMYYIMFRSGNEQVMRKIIISK